MISALDYKRFCKQHPGHPLPIVVRGASGGDSEAEPVYFPGSVLKDANFGELFVGSHKADSIDHLFISIQTF